MMPSCIRIAITDRYQIQRSSKPGKRASKDEVVPGEIIAADGDIELNAGRRKATLKVVNTGDRPIQIGSHYHFFETK